MISGLPAVAAVQSRPQTNRIEQMTAGMSFFTANLVLVEELGDSERAVLAGRFVRYGFKVDRVVGGSLQLTAGAELFRGVFGVDIERGPNGEPGVRMSGEFGYEFPLDRLPSDLRCHIRACGFEPPMDFGPGNP